MNVMGELKNATMERWLYADIPLGVNNAGRFGMSTDLVSFNIIADDGTLIELGDSRTDIQIISALDLYTINVLTPAVSASGSSTLTSATEYTDTNLSAHASTFHEDELEVSNHVITAVSTSSIYNSNLSVDAGSNDYILVYARLTLASGLSTTMWIDVFKTGVPLDKIHSETVTIDGGDVYISFMIPLMPAATTAYTVQLTGTHGSAFSGEYKVIQRRPRL